MHAWWRAMNLSHAFGRVRLGRENGIATLEFFPMASACFTRGHIGKSAGRLGSLLARRRPHKSRTRLHNSFDSSSAANRYTPKMLSHAATRSAAASRCSYQMLNPSNLVAKRAICASIIDISKCRRRNPDPQIAPPPFRCRGS